MTSIRFYLILMTIQIFVIFSAVQAQQLSAEKWQEDLRYLRQVVTTERSNLFHTITREAWEKMATDLEQRIPTMQQHEIIVGLASLVAAFRIGHTQMSISPWRESVNPQHRFHKFPVRLYAFQDGVYIRSAKKSYRDAVGGRVIKIGNRSIEAAMEAVRPVIPWENEQYFLSTMPSYLSCPEILHARGVIEELDQATIVIEKEGVEKAVLLRAEPAGSVDHRFGILADEHSWVDARRLSGNPVPLYQQRLDKNFYYTYLPEHKLVYVRHSSVRNQADETIEQFFGRVMQFVDNNDVEKFVLDVRLNGGGNNYLNRPVIVGLIGNRKINQPGKLFTIIGRQTFSAAQNLVNEIEKYTETIFVGEPTSENVNFWGDNRTYELPNSGMPVRLSWLWWQNHDPRDNRPWLAPDIAVDLTFVDYRDNRDPVMEEILRYQQHNSLTERLKALLLSGKFDEASQAGASYSSDSRNRYHNVETDINHLGYELLGQDEMDAAIAAFRLNTELYPNSANTFDSLAESLWKKGDLKGAIEHYQRAIKMDPEGVGGNATRMLQQIRQQMGEAK